MYLYLNVFAGSKIPHVRYLFKFFIPIYLTMILFIVLKVDAVYDVL